MGLWKWLQGHGVDKIDVGRCCRSFTAVVSYDPREIVCSFLSPEAQCVVATVSRKLREDEGRLLEEYNKRRTPLCAAVTKLALCLNWRALTVVGTESDDGLLQLWEVELPDDAEYVTSSISSVTLRPTGATRYIACSSPQLLTSLSVHTAMIEGGEYSMERLADSFLVGSRLCTVDFTGMTALTSCGSSFLSWSSVSSVNLSGLRNLVECGDEFLLATDRLCTADLSGMTALTTCGSSFLSGCMVSSVNLSGFSNLVECGDDFLFCTKQLCTADFSGMTALTSCGSQFLSESSVSSVNLRGLCNLVECGGDFLACSKQLCTADLSGMTALSACGPFFLGESSVSSVNLSGLSNLVECGAGFLALTHQLSSVNLSGPTALTSRRSGNGLWTSLYSVICRM